MNRIVRFCLAGMVLSMLSWPVSAGEVRVASDEWCPYLCASEPDGGMGMALLKRLAELTGSKLSIRTMPFSRAKAMARRGELDLVPFVSRNDELVLLEPAIFRTRGCFFTRPEQGWLFKDASSLDDIRLGRAMAYDEIPSQDPDIITAFSRLRNTRRLDIAIGDNPSLVNLRKLAAGRIDAILTDRNVGPWLAAKQGIPLRAAGCLPDQVDEFLGFSPHFPAAEREQWQSALRGMVQRGELTSLLRRYRLKFD